MPDSLAEALREARGEMSLAEAALESGIPEDRSEMYERGVRHPYGKTLRRLADAYGVRAGVFSRGVQDSASAAPRRRYRRRRDLGGYAAVPAVVEIPADVLDGTRVRIVLELVVKAPASGNQARSSVTRSEPTRDYPRLAAERVGSSEEVPRVARDASATLREEYGRFREGRR